MFVVFKIWNPLPLESKISQCILETRGEKLHAFLLIIPFYASRLSRRSIDLNVHQHAIVSSGRYKSWRFPFRVSENLVLAFVVLLELWIAPVLSSTFCVFAPPCYKTQTTFLVSKHSTDSGESGNGICNIRHCTGWVSWSAQPWSELVRL
jgi:hypothetical protein